MKKVTQAHMGKNQLIDRLTAQVGGDRQLALKLLVERGHVYPGTERLTPEGQKRDNMTAEERAKDRAARATKQSPSAFKYNPRTNRATRKR